MVLLITPQLNMLNPGYISALPISLSSGTLSASSPSLTASLVLLIGEVRRRYIYRVDTLNFIAVDQFYIWRGSIHISYMHRSIQGSVR